MDTFDISWKTPNQEQIDALHLVCKRLKRQVPSQEPMSWHQQVLMQSSYNAFTGGKAKPSEFEMAEMVVTMKQTLGYSQLTNWIANEQAWMPKTFKPEAALLKGIIDGGYTRDGWNKQVNEMGMMFLIDFRDMLHQLSRNQIVAQSLFILLDLLIVAPKKSKKANTQP